MEASNSKMKLKLLIDKKQKKVLFAEANKDFVDFLFSLMSLPLGTIIKLLTKNHMSGCLGNLYHSIESLSDTYFQPTKTKDSILNPKFPLKIEAPLLLTGADSAPTQNIYMCIYNNHKYVTYDPNAKCVSCHHGVAQASYFSAPSGANAAATTSSKAAEGGLVKGVVTYMVMDDLDVKPMSTISSITLLNSFNVLDLTSLQEKVVDIGVAEGLRLFPVQECSYRCLPLKQESMITTVPFKYPYLVTFSVSNNFTY